MWGRMDIVSSLSLPLGLLWLLRLCVLVCTHSRARTRGRVAASVAKAAGPSRGGEMEEGRRATSIVVLDGQRASGK